MIVANKTDQDPGLREVTREEGHVFAIENGSRDYETSAKDPQKGPDIKDVFQGQSINCRFQKSSHNFGLIKKH